MVHINDVGNDIYFKYRIDPFKQDQFKEYAQAWGCIIPACGGNLVGYFMSHEGTNYEAFGIISFESLAEYEQYRARLKMDPEGKRNFEFAQKNKFILSEERTFLQEVPETYMKSATRKN